MTAATILLLIIVAAGLFLGRKQLVLRNDITGEVYARYALRAGEPFSISFIHSVNNTRVTDVYDARSDGRIFLRKTIYYDFGAGVPFDLNEGETLSYAEDGAMIISGIDREIPKFLLIVGTVSDHTLSLRGEEISLRDLCGRNTRIQIAYESLLFG